MKSDFATGFDKETMNLVECTLFWMRFQEGMSIKECFSRMEIDDDIGGSFQSLSIVVGKNRESDSHQEFVFNLDQAWGDEGKHIAAAQ